MDRIGTYAPAGTNRTVIGAKGVDLIHKLNDTGDGQSLLTEVTEGTVVDGLDATSRAGYIRPLLQNDTGDAVILSDVGIIGKPVFRLADAAGYIHDKYRDVEDIRLNGERLFEFGNRDMIDPGQLSAMAEYVWEFGRGKKHSYQFALDGLQHQLHPGQRVTLDIGTAGLAENINSLVEIRSLSYINEMNAAPVTFISATEVLENWKQNSTAWTRFFAPGNNTAIQPKGNNVVIGAGARIVKPVSPAGIPVTLPVGAYF